MKVKKIGRKIRYSCILGILIAFCYVGGKQLDILDSINFLDKTFYLKWLGFSVPATLIIYGIFSLFSYLETKKKEQREDKIPMWLLFTGGAVLLFICWLPTLLSLFPGAFSYDAYEEWQQVKNGVITSHHPVLHVLFLGGLVEGFYTLTGSYNVGIAIYSVIQMALLACALSYSVCFLREIKMPRIVQYGTLIFYGISPVIGLFSISATKDVLFTAAELLFFIFCIRILFNRDKFFEKKGWKAGFVVAALGTMILRNNGLYVAVIMLLIFAVICRKYWKKYLLLMVAVIVPYILYAGPVYQALDVTKGGVQEMLSVPIQQMARVYHSGAGEMALEDLETLYKYLPKENLEAYKSTVADPVKTGFNGEYFRDNKAEFVKLWAKLLVENPLTYVNSFLTNTVDFWYPNAVVDGYQDAYGRSSYFDYRVAEPGEEVVIFDSLHAVYEAISWDKEAQTKPLAFFMLSPGWYFVCVLVTIAYFLYSRRYQMVLVSLIFVLSFLTVLLGPMALVRYVLIFYFGIPLLVALCFGKLDGEKVTEKVKKFRRKKL